MFPTTFIRRINEKKNIVDLYAQHNKCLEVPSEIEKLIKQKIHEIIYAIPNLPFFCHILLWKKNTLTNIN
jgi:hypothetical protein